MTKIIHLANTDVEFEYAHPSKFSFGRSWSLHPLCLQLQYLPLLYAKADDLVAVTEYPDDAYLSGLKQSGWWPEGLPRMVLLDSSESLEGMCCLSWGPSRQVEAWAAERGIQYAFPPDWNNVRLVNSKAFSFRFSTLSDAALLANEQELVHWLEKTNGPKVIKTCYGLSGLGNRRTDGPKATDALLSFCRKEWANKRPVVGEPWLDRIRDFSTQWKIHQGGYIEWMGATRFEADAHGIYQGTLAGPEELLFGLLEMFLEQHRQYVLKALKEVAAKGFFGSIGFDALLYRDPDNHSTCLYPLVEINGRMTMSLVALLLQKRICPDRVLKLSFNRSGDAFTSLLPDHCHDDKGKLIHFNRRLTAAIL